MDFVIILQQADVRREGLTSRGNSPDHKLKSLINIKCEGGFKFLFKGKFARGSNLLMKA